MPPPPSLQAPSFPASAAVSPPSASPFTIKIDSVFILLSTLFLVVQIFMQHSFGSDQQTDIIGIYSVYVVLAAVGAIAFFFTILPILQVKLQYAPVTSDVLLSLAYYFPYMVVMLVVNAFGATPLSHISVDSLWTFAATSYIIVNALAEEILFTFFLTTLVIALAHNKVSRGIGYVAVAATFAFYHAFVYTEWTQYVMAFVFRLLMIYAYKQTQRPSVVALVHIFNNTLVVIAQQFL